MAIFSEQGSELAHVGVIFHEPLPQGALTTAETLVRLRLLSSQWTARSFRIWMINWPRLVWSLEWPPPGARSSVVYRGVGRSFVDRTVRNGVKYAYEVCSGRLRLG